MKLSKQEKKERAKIIKDRLDFQKNYFSLVESLNKVKNAYDKLGNVPTNLYLTSPSAPIILQRSNVFLAFNEYIWEKLNSAQKVCCFEYFINNVCDEFGIEYKKIKFPVPDPEVDDLNEYLIAVQGNDVFFDARLFCDDIHPLDIAVEVMGYICQDNANSDKKEILKSVGDDISKVDSLYDLETVVFPTDEYCVLLPRYYEDTKHIINIINGLDRMCLFVKEYKDTKIDSLVEQFEYVLSNEYQQEVKTKYGLLYLDYNGLNAKLKQIMLDEYKKQNENITKQNELDRDLGMDK